MGVRVHTVDELHQKMGHISLTVIKWLIKQKIILGLELDVKSETSFCPTCSKAKPTRKPVPKEKVKYISQALGDKIHSDMWGPVTPQSYNGKLYYMSFTNEYTRWTMIYCISWTLEVLSKYKEYKAWMRTQYGKCIKILQSDSGGEYLSKEFNTHLETQGTIRSLTVHDTPKENGVTEWLNHTLLEHVRAMLLTAQLPKNLWPETIHHAMWLKNRTSMGALNGWPPYEVMHNAKPNLADLPDWGARVFVMKINAGKLENKGMEGFWLGYSGTSKGHPKYIPNQQIMVECNVSFKDTVRSSL